MTNDQTKAVLHLVGGVEDGQVEEMYSGRVPAVGEIVVQHGAEYRVEEVRWAEGHPSRSHRVAHLTLAPVDPMPDEVAVLAEEIWNASRADEGSISATGANKVAAAILTRFKVEAR